MTTQMTIGEAARRADVGVETIRFYERKGLVEQPLEAVEVGLRDLQFEIRPYRLVSIRVKFFTE